MRPIIFYFQPTLLASYLICLLMGACANPEKAQLIQLRQGEPHSIYPDFVGVNGNLTQFDSPWENQALMAAFKKLGVGNLRYPAGTLGNTWDWEKGWLDSEVADEDLIPWVVEQNLKESPKRYTLENLALVCRETGTKPVFMLNMLTRDLNHSITALKKAESLGMPIEYIELGNELYFNLSLEMRMYPTPEDLGKTSEEWQRKLKIVFPDARIAVIGTTINRKPRHANWNQRLLGEAPSSMAVTKHMYSPLGIRGEKEKAEITAGQEGLSGEEKKKSTQLYQKEELALLGKEAHYTNMLTTAAHKAEEFTQMGLPDSLDIWITEFNLRADKSAIRGTWANSLVLSVFYETFFRHKQVKLCNVHNITGSKFAVIYDVNPLDHVVDERVYRKPWSLSAAGLSTSYFAQASRGKVSCTPMKFDDAPVLIDLSGNTYEALCGFVFSHEGEKKRGILINYSSQPFTLDSQQLHSGEVTFRQASAPLTHYVMDEEGMEIMEGSTTDLLTLVPFSITIIEFP
ncbi:MAG: hypothetical protein AAFR66_03710 [Bacteroidota bacterium]